MHFTNRYAGRTAKHPVGVGGAPGNGVHTGIPSMATSPIAVSARRRAGGRTAPLWRVTTDYQGRYARRTDDHRQPLHVFRRG